MFKKLLIVSTILAASSTMAFAGHMSYKGDYKGEMPTAAPCQTNIGVGPYLGLSVGPRVNVAPLGAFPSTYVGFEGTGSLGYGMMAYPGFYLAGEVFGGGSFNIKNYTNAGNSSPRTTWNFGASILPGFLITNDLLGYVRAGVIRSHFNNAAITTAEGTFGRNNRSLTGWQVGVGGQHNVMPNLDLRMEYVYSQYSSQNTLGTPMAHQVNVGVVYRFM